jgi:hypothetical protein
VLVTGVIGYITGKRKNAAEVEGMEVTNDKEILSTYKTELEYFRTQLEFTRTELTALRSELDKFIKASCAREDCPNRVK